MAARRHRVEPDVAGEPLQRVLPGVDAYEGPRGELDWLPQPPELPRWVERLDDWLGGQLSKPTPRGLRWLDDLEDRLPVWALPWLITGLMGGLVAVIYGLVPLVKGWIR